jgi:hypothetical protein
MGGRIDVLEFDIANLLERNAELHTELKSWKEDIKEIGNRSTEFAHDVRYDIFNIFSFYNFVQSSFNSF